MTTFTEIPIIDPDLNAPARGVEQWHGANDVNVPIAGTNTQRLDYYFRFPATRIAGATQGSYNWTFFDNEMNRAISRKQRVSFGIMTSYPEADTSLGLAAFDGGFASYSEYVHKQMQAESVKDWRKGSTWTPNYNSPSYLNWLLGLHKEVDNHIKTTSFNNVKYADVILWIDIRGYGSWGEWNSSSLVNHTNEYPAGTFPTTTSLKKIVDAHRDGFPDFQLQAMIAGFDANWLGVVNNPPEIAYYLLTQRNNYGPYGWRRDQWGALDNYLKDYLEFNNRSFGGIVFKDLIMERWKTAPITGEPAPFSNDMADLERQIRLYHASSFGNGNYGNTPNTAVQERVRVASKAAGYRLKMINADVTSSARVVTVKINWQNVGIAPVYEKHWETILEFVDTAGVVKHTHVSSFQPRLFLPQPTSNLITDIVTMPTTVPSATFTVRVAIKDKTKFRDPLPLAVKNKNADGSYNLGTVAVSGTVIPPVPPTNVLPVVIAGPDIIITQPITQVTLIGLATDAEGPVSVLWTKRTTGGCGNIANPNSTTTIVTDLPVGKHTYRLAGTDNSQAVVWDELSVTVLPEPVTPPDILVDVKSVYNEAVIELTDGRVVRKRLS